MTKYQLKKLQAAKENLRPDEQAVMDFMSPGAAFTRPQLLQFCGLNAMKLNNALRGLCIRGELVEVPPATLKDEISYTMPA